MDIINLHEQCRKLIESIVSVDGREITVHTRTTTKRFEKYILYSKEIYG